MSQSPIKNPWNRFVKQNYEKAKLALLHENFEATPTAISLLLREMYKQKRLFSRRK